MSAFSERLASTFATLVRPLTPGDGEPEANIAEAEDRLGLKLPSVLRAYYVMAGRFDQFNRAHNRLLRPEEWSVDGGKLVFLEENQGVVSWGVEASRSPEEDPPVYQGPNVRGQPTEWYLEHETCSEFLLVMLHLQAVWGGYESIGGSEITPEALERFLAAWTLAGRVNELPEGPWLLPAHRDDGARFLLDHPPPGPGLTIPRRIGGRNPGPRDAWRADR